jgi:hypothetical protein
MRHRIRLGRLRLGWLRLGWLRLGWLRPARLRRFLTIHERGMWELMAAMAYACPVALYPYTELRPDRANPQHDAYAWLRIRFARSPEPRDHDLDPPAPAPRAGEPDYDLPEVSLTETERRAWSQLSQEFDAPRGGRAGLRRKRRLSTRP